MDIITGVIIIVAIVIIIDLQRQLSKRENRWLGLILPAISLLFSIGFCIWVSLFGISETYIVHMADGTAFSFESKQHADAFQSTVDQKEIVKVSQVKGIQAKIGAGIVPLHILFLELNIITFILLMIYFSYKKYRRMDLSLSN